MPDPEIEEVAQVEPEVVAPSHCRHCGEEHEGDVPESGDFLCVHCGHYQDSMVCPTCKQPTRISLMPADLAPAVHKPKKGKE